MFFWGFFVFVFGPDPGFLKLFVCRFLDAHQSFIIVFGVGPERDVADTRGAETISEPLNTNGGIGLHCINGK